MIVMAMNCGSVPYYCTAKNLMKNYEQPVKLQVQAAKTAAKQLTVMPHWTDDQQPNKLC